MKKVFILLGLVMVMTIGINSTGFVHSNPTGAPASRTGAPRLTTGNETTCAASGCHGTANLNNGPHMISLQIAGDSGGMMPDSTYTMTTTIVNGTGTAAGFQMVCINPDRVACGSWVIGAGTKLVSGAGRAYITHNSKNRKTWTFNWKAPADLPDSAVFYFAAQETVSGSFHTYTSSKVFRSATLLTRIKEAKSATEFKIFPVPASTEINVAIGDFSIANHIEIMGLDGKCVLSQDVESGINRMKINLPETMKPGHYIMRVLNEKGMTTKRFIRI